MTFRRTFRLAVLLVAFALLFVSLAFKALGMTEAETVTRWITMALVLGAAISIVTEQP